MEAVAEMASQYQVITSNENPEQHNQFAQDVLKGLSQPQKEISSKYFYDAIGGQIYNEITRLEEYYLTGCEQEIFQQHKANLSKAFCSEPFNLVELGPGEGKKTKILLEQLLTDGAQVNYIPVDISEDYIKQIINKFNHELPKLEINAIVAEYLPGLEWLSHNSTARNIVFFSGSTIGNFGIEEGGVLLQSLWNALSQDDLLLLGADLQKEITTLFKAYNDSEGVTARFNLNLLTRINRELGGNFDLAKFYHYGAYNVRAGAMESFLISKENQSVFIEALGRSFDFYQWEPLQTERSQKYLLSDLEQMAKGAGFSVVENFIDARGYFVDSLWRVVKN